jgi:GNAT superfamily N-acetyltransferase
MADVPTDCDATVRIVQVVENLPPGFETLRDEARAEGYRMLDRLATDWDTGALRFNRPGEALLVAYIGGTLAGVGGITVDPDTPGALRMRRFYVHPSSRRDGIGRKLVQAILATVPGSAGVITVNAAGGSEPFWEALGFSPKAGESHTHVLRQSETAGP